MRANVISLGRAIAAIILTALTLSLSTLSRNVASAHPIDRSSPSVRIGVLGLFHPTHLTITAISGHALLLNAGTETIALETSSGVASARLQLSGTQIGVTAGSRVFRSPHLLVTGRNGEPVDFQLAILGKITRRYHGSFQLLTSGAEITAIVTMDLETAVASVVAAESTANTPSEAMKAQAIATRSYLISGRGRHHGFDFCDTTHCQFLREPPKPGTPVVQAVSATRGLVLAYNSQPFPAMYTRSCGGHTRTPALQGLSANGYPYYSVDCRYCLTHPAHWTARIPLEDASSLHSSNEASRLQVVRHLGWNTVPSNDFSSTKSGNNVLLRGTGYGHGIGLCQAGAKAMAEEGATFQQILMHYYPNTTVIELTHAD